VRRLVTIVRREAAAGVSAALLHIADACCVANVAIPPVLPAGQEPRNFGLHLVKQLAVVRQLTDIIPPAGPGVRRSDSRGSAIRKIFRTSPTLRDGWEPG
jgi:hypothetical protein